jgi:hypothetical protein
MEWLASFFAGWKAWVAALGVTTLVAAGGGFYAGHHWAGDDLQQLRAQVAQQHADTADASLKKLQGFIDQMQVASQEYGQSRDQMFARLDLLRKEFRNAVKAAPLPADCRPDAVRVRNLSEAVDTTNAAIAAPTGGGFGETVRTHPNAGGS